MNVALFSDSYFPTKSGVVAVVVQLRKVLEKMGHHVVIVTVDAENSSEPQEDDECILRVPSIQAPMGDNQFVGDPFEIASLMCVNFCKKHDIQIVHAHTEFSLGHLARVVGRRLNIPVVATTHTMWEDYYKYYLKTGKIIPKRVVRRLVHAAYKHFYALINVSQKAHDYFKEPFILPSTPSVVIPNAIDMELFEKRTTDAAEVLQIKEKFGIKDSDKIILYVGRIVEEKRIVELLEVLIRVVAKDDNKKVLFVGDGFALKKLQERVVEVDLEKNILFAGFVDWLKLNAYYELGDVFVTASLSEMHSMTILEAMCLSLPIVCRYDTSFTDTVFHGENGYFANSDEEMDSYINKILENDQLRQKMAAKSKELSKNFTLDLHGERTLRFYEAVLAKFPEKITDQELYAAVYGN